MDVAAGVEVTDDGHFARGRNLNQILQNPVDGIFVENPHVPVALDVKLERFQLDALLIRDVVDFDDGKIRQAGTGADAGELRTGDGNRVVPPGILVLKRLQNFRLNRHTIYIRKAVLDGKRRKKENSRRKNYLAGPSVPC